MSEKVSAVAAFDAARADFERALEVVPDEALGYSPPGDEYVLGGLLVHVIDGLRHYGGILRQMIADDFAEQRPAAYPPSRLGAETPERGFDPADRKAMLDVLANAHARLAVTAAALPEAQFSRSAPVIYSSAEPPYDTSAAAIVGWMTDHYREHAAQIGDLLAHWRAVPRKSDG